MSLARRKRDRILAAQTINAAAAPVVGVAVAPAAVPPSPVGANPATPAERAAAQISLRLRHDLQRLKAIRSIDRKIEAKREMLPEYKGWVEGVVMADSGVGSGQSADVVPTYMVWLIDVGAFMDGLNIAEFLLRHRVEMPKRYERDVATFVVEQIAEAAAKTQNAGEAFDCAVLDTAENLTAGLDIHDQVRAKLLKAIGIEQLRKAEEMPAEGSSVVVVLQSALINLREAQRLNDRVGVKDRIKRGDKLLAAINAAAAPPNNETGGTAA